MAMLAKWASMQYFQCFQIKLLVFCMNTMIHRTPLWACLLSRWTGVISVFTASSDQNRYKYEIYVSYAKYEQYANRLSYMHILHIVHINPKYDEQNRALLDTLRIHRSNNNQGHIVLYTTLLIGHTQHPGHMRVSSRPMVPKKLQQTNRQDWVFIRPPGISDGAFQLRMDNIWFCKLLLLFKIYTKTDAGMQYQECAYVSVLEEYKGPRKSGHTLHILHILHILIYLTTSAWVDQCQSAMIYERQEQAQVLYVIPVSSILGRLPLVPVGAT